MSDSPPPPPTPAIPVEGPCPSAAPQPLEEPTRRGFLAAASCALAVCAGAATLGPALLAIVSTAHGGIVRIGDGTLDLGPLDQYEDGVPRRVVIRGARTDAFMKLPERALGSVLVVRRGAEVAVYSTACPHAGCEVSPREKEKDLFCPCHESAFALDGKVTAGPAPRGLDSLEASVAQGHVRVRYERFQLGTADKRAV